MRKLFTLFCLVFSTLVLQAQELTWNVVIDNQRVPNLQANILADIKTSITNFLNTNNRWTDHIFKPEERIKCNLNIQLLSNPNIGVYTATAQIQASRPVYGTNYESTIMNFLDKDFDFELQQGQPLIFNDNVFTTNITSLLAFYSYMVLALDYDSFSKLGGSPWMEKARNIMFAAQGNAPGWLPTDINNRASLFNDLFNQQFEAFRLSFYDYHRIAMDQFINKPEQSRQVILDCLTKIKTVYMIKPSSILIKTFFLSKREELIHIFSKGTPEQKQKAYNLLRDMDPSYVEKYAAITK
jgi:hypothetical protein